MASEDGNKTPYSSIYTFLKPDQVLTTTAPLPPPPPPEDQVVPKKLRKVALCCAHGAPCPIGIKEMNQGKKIENKKDEDESSAYVNLDPTKKKKNKSKYRGKCGKSYRRSQKAASSDVSSRKSKKKSKASRRMREMMKKAKKAKKEAETAVSENGTGENSVTEEETSKTGEKKTSVVVEAKGENSDSQDSSRREVSVEPPSEPVVVPVEALQNSEAVAPPPQPATDSKDEEESAYVNLCPTKKARDQAAKAIVPGNEIKEEASEASATSNQETSDASSTSGESKRSRRKNKKGKKKRRNRKVTIEEPVVPKMFGKSKRVKEEAKEEEKTDGAATVDKEVHGDPSEPIKKDSKDEEKKPAAEVIEPKKLAPMVLETPPPDGVLSSTSSSSFCSSVALPSKRAVSRAKKAYLGSMTAQQAQAALQNKDVGLYHRKYDVESELEAGMFVVCREGKGGKMRHWRVKRRPAPHGFEFVVESGKGVPEGRHRTLTHLVFYYEKKAQE